MTESIGPHNLRSRSELRHCIMFLFIISRARFQFLEFGGLRQVCDRYSRKLVTFNTQVNDDLHLRGNPSEIHSPGRAGKALVSQEMTSHITDSSGRNTILSGQHKSRPNFERHDANEISQCQLHPSFAGKPVRKMHQNILCSSRDSH